MTNTRFLKELWFSGSFANDAASQDFLARAARIAGGSSHVEVKGKSYCLVAADSVRNHEDRVLRLVREFRHLDQARLERTFSPLFGLAVFVPHMRNPDTEGRRTPLLGETLRRQLRTALGRQLKQLPPELHSATGIGLDGRGEVVSDTSEVWLFQNCKVLTAFELDAIRKCLFSQPDWDQDTVYAGCGGQAVLIERDVASDECDGERAAA